MLTMPKADHRFDAVRGLTLGVLLGAALWITVGGIVWALVSYRLGPLIAPVDGLASARDVLGEPRLMSAVGVAAGAAPPRP
jgi:hypothetical protein